MRHYNWEKCNNLLWENKTDGRSGIVRKSVTTVVLYELRGRGEFRTIYKEFDIYAEAIELDNFLRDNDFRIVPRSEGTYDYYEGDIVKRLSDSKLYEIIKITYRSYLLAEVVPAMATIERGLLVVDYSQLTSLFVYSPKPYEQALSKAMKADIYTIELNSTCLWRDSIDEDWKSGDFEGYGSGDKHYFVDKVARLFAIPFNEQTWHLLNTDLPVPEDFEL